jgi:hypothetical protein
MIVHRIAPVAALFLAACARGPSDDESASQANPSPPASAPASPPVDHLAPEELIEGDAHAYGIVLPRDFQVDSMFSDSMTVIGRAGVHPTAKYLRARVEGGSFDEDDSAATFTHVRIASQPGRDFSIRVGRALGGGVRVDFHDTTPKVLPQYPDEAARWRAVGLTPQGRVLDPTHLE